MSAESLSTGGRATGVRTTIQTQPEAQLTGRDASARGTARRRNFQSLAICKESVGCRTDRSGQLPGKSEN